MANNKSDQLSRLTQEVVLDYFSRLGGSGKYSGYADWHGFAMVALIGLDPDLEITLQNLYENNISISTYSDKLFHETGDLGKRVTVAVNSISPTKNDVRQFLFEADDRYTKNALSQLQHARGDLSPEDHIGQVKAWGAFYCFMITALNQ